MSELQNQKRKEDLRSKLNTFANRAAVIATPILFAAAAHAEDSSIDIGTLGLVGLASAASTVFAIKASPSLMMWGYSQILKFTNRG